MKAAIIFVAAICAAQVMPATGDISQTQLLEMRARMGRTLKSLPNYLCLQTTERLRASKSRAKTKALDSVELDVAVKPAIVTRVSLGAQSFDDAVLRWMHRVHDAQAVSRAVHDLRAAGISSLSLDLIFALPESLNRDWRRDLELALELAPDHLSLYGLTVEPATPLARWTARGDAAEAPEERYASEFLLAHDRATAAGLSHYEVSNFGRPGAEARHNASYWSGVPYAGLGPSAHEFDGSTRRWNAAPYAEWLRRVGAGTDPLEGSEQLSADQKVEEAVFLSLRTTAGLALAEPEWSIAKPWIESGWARRVGDRVALTPEGWLRMDAIALTVVRSRL